MVMGSLTQETELAVIGSGPGGYVAAIRAAALGREVVLIEEREQHGGVCLIEGCIPSKALINAVEIAQAAAEAKRFGFSYGDPSIDLDALRKFVEKTVSGLTGGIEVLLKRRGVEVIHGRARFESTDTLAIDGGDVAGIKYKHAIIASGSRPSQLALANDLPVWTSTEAISLPRVPQRLVIVGGGYIGVELGLVYAGLGAEVTMVEFAPRLLVGADGDLVDVMVRAVSRRLHDLRVDSKVVGLDQTGDTWRVDVEHEGERQTLEADQVLVAVGRTPNTDDLGLDKIGLSPGRFGHLEVDEVGRTKAEGVWAIGDVTPGPMLAHKASREAKVVAEAISDHDSAFDNRAIPAVVYTDPEIAWAGLTEREARAKDIPIKVGRFPLRALGRARTLGRTDGLVKVLAEPDSGLLLGVGMVGPGVSELIAEGTLALEMGATLEDLMVTIHPHPTLSEAIMEAAEVAADQPVHVLPQKPS